MVSLPKPFDSIEKVDLLFPQPPQVQSLRRLTAHLASEYADSPPHLYMCREDCNSYIGFGGNKVRKLEYVIVDVLSSGATTIVTTGGIQSNHQRAVAATAASLGLKCVLVPRNAVAESDMGSGALGAYRSSGNVQLTQLLGAEIMPVGRDKDEVLKELSERGEKPYWIPSGSSLHEKGGLGYARWAFEIEELERRTGKYFHTIIATSASGSTLGGMVAGFKCAQILGDQDTSEQSGGRRLIGIAAFAKEGDETAQTVLKVAKTTASLIGLKETDISMDDFKIDLRFNAGAYGRCDEKTLKAIKLMAQLEGVVMDPVYTGKMTAGVIDMFRSGEFEKDENILMVHTGGQVALAAYPDVV